jgi:hypothetical protein
MKVTQWFDGKENPINEGLYEFYATWNEDKLIFNATWANGKWSVKHIHPFSFGCWLNEETCFKWRGVAKP